MNVSNNPFRTSKIVVRWLFLGLVLIFVQIIIGGITRLTDSGLSITEWNVIKGTLPPLSEDAWADAFLKYKTHAKQQYESLHLGMTLSEFKFIYFWEYFHRLWARMMGFIFIIPFVIFLYLKMIPKPLISRLIIVFLLAGAAGIFGWIMVASGLNDDTRTWVSAYKLITHLGIATLLFAYLYWTYLLAKDATRLNNNSFSKYASKAWLFFFLLIIQVLFGGLMAGMKAGLLHPYFPFFVHGDNLWNALNNSTKVGLSNFIDYEPSTFVKGLVQIFHRTFAYVLFFFGYYLFFTFRKIKNLPSIIYNTNIALVVLLTIQFILGVLTVINCFGKVPVVLGSVHQAVALLVIIASLRFCYVFKRF